MPKVASARIVDVANALMGAKKLPIAFTGIRPGEKIHEIMVSEEECFRTVENNGYYVILPVLPELRGSGEIMPALETEYSSRDNNISGEKLLELLRRADHEIERFITAV